MPRRIHFPGHSYPSRTRKSQFKRHCAHSLVLTATISSVLTTIFSVGGRQGQQTSYIPQETSSDFYPAGRPYSRRRAYASTARINWSPAGHGIVAESRQYTLSWTRRGKRGYVCGAAWRSPRGLRKSCNLNLRRCMGFVWSSTEYAYLQIQQWLLSVAPNMIPE